MALIEMDFMNGGDSGGTVYTVNMAHKAQNATTIYYSTGELAKNIPSSYVEPSDNSFSATNYGGTFDATLVCSSSVSVRVHSTDYQNNYILVDVIVNGVTVSADNQIKVLQMQSTARLDLIWGFNFTLIV